MNEGPFHSLSVIILATRSSMFCTTPDRRKKERKKEEKKKKTTANDMNNERNQFSLKRAYVFLTLQSNLFYPRSVPML